MAVVESRTTVRSSSSIAMSSPSGPIRRQSIAIPRSSDAFSPRSDAFSPRSDAYSPQSDAISQSSDAFSRPWKPISRPSKASRRYRTNPRQRRLPSRAAGKPARGRRRPPRAGRKRSRQPGKRLANVARVLANVASLLAAIGSLLASVGSLLYSVGNDLYSVGNRLDSVGTCFAVATCVKRLLSCQFGCNPANIVRAISHTAGHRRHPTRKAIRYLHEHASAWQPQFVETMRTQALRNSLMAVFFASNPSLPPSRGADATAKSHHGRGFEDSAPATPPRPSIAFAICSRTYSSRVGSCSFSCNISSTSCRFSALGLRPATTDAAQ